MASSQHPPCAAVLREHFAEYGLRIAVSTAPPIVARPDITEPFACRHGIAYWVTPERSAAGRSMPRWLRYLVAIPLMAAWVLLAAVAVASSAWLPLACGAGVNSAVGCGVVTLAAAAVCTWPLMDLLVGWAEGGTS